MIIKIIGTLIGALILGAGLFYFVKEKRDPESRRIYGIVSGVGGVIFMVMLALTVMALM